MSKNYRASGGGGTGELIIGGSNSSAEPRVLNTERIGAKNKKIIGGDGASRGAVGASGGTMLKKK